MPPKCLPQMSFVLSLTLSIAHMAGTGSDQASQGAMRNESLVRPELSLFYLNCGAYSPGEHRPNP